MCIISSYKPCKTHTVTSTQKSAPHPQAEHSHVWANSSPTVLLAGLEGGYPTHRPGALLLVLFTQATNHTPHTGCPGEFHVYGLGPTQLRGTTGLTLKTRSLEGLLCPRSKSTGELCKPNKNQDELSTSLKKFEVKFV